MGNDYFKRFGLLQLVKDIDSPLFLLERSHK
jgi:hypothetical protein